MDLGSPGMWKLMERNSILRSERKEVLLLELTSHDTWRSFIYRTVREDLSKLRVRLKGIVFEEMVR